MSAGRTIAVGDIHGCSMELSRLIEVLSLTANDTVVFLGDYIDRGPDSKGVIDLIVDLRDKCNVVTLKGNHEAMFIDFLESPESAGAGLFVLNGGSATLASYAGERGSFVLPESHIKFLYDLKLTFETDTHFFVHAGVPLKPLNELDEQAEETTLLWSRQPFLSTTQKWEKVIVHGHTPVNDVEVKPNRINVDTGCVYDNHLSAIELPSGRIYRIPRRAGLKPVLFPIEADSPRVAVRFSGRLPVRASKPGKSQIDFETLNYNQFGLLMEQKGTSFSVPFAVGDRIEGVIGEDGQTAIEFQGEVVRIETRSERRLFGVRIDRVKNGDDGRVWIERPS
ncbi:MAG TPA: metallophosphoesterase family protein [Bdellovibrionales bacterium]|nr:metallophosphoesterase family protein [Bdellovibrionales bacterium]